jgi:hypothetical protein
LDCAAAVDNAFPPAKLSPPLSLEVTCFISLHAVTVDGIKSGFSSGFLFTPLISVDRRRLSGLFIRCRRGP